MIIPTIARKNVAIALGLALCLPLAACGGGGGGDGNDEDPILLASLAFHICGERDQNGNAIGVLSDGSFVLGGMLMRTTIFGEGQPNETTLTPSGSTDAFLARYDIDGVLLWVRSFGGPSLAAESVSHLAVFPDNSIAAIGVVSGAVVFGAGEPNETTINADNGDVYLARFGANGSLVYATNATAPFADNPTGVLALSDGSCVIAGDTQDDISFDAITLVMEGFGQDGWIARYDPAGNAVWARSFGGSGFQDVTAIALAPNGTIHAAGFHALDMTLGAGEPNETLLEDDAAFVASFSSSGTLLEARDLTDNDAPSVTGLAVLANGARILTGTAQSDVTFLPGEASEETFTPVDGRDIFLLRLSSGGAIQWFRTAMGAGFDFVGTLTLLTDGSVVIAGEFEQELQLEGGNAGDVLLQGDGGGEVLIARYSANGDLLFARGTTGNTTRRSQARGVAVGPFGTIMATGIFQEEITISLPPEESVSFDGVDDNDLFVVRFQQNGTFTSPEVEPGS